MNQKPKPRIVIDINKHGIRREINLDSTWRKKHYDKRFNKLSTGKKKLSTDNRKLSTALSTDN